MKRTLTATCPDGTKVTRKTDREYKFVVIGQSHRNSQQWYAEHWTSRRDLAEKEAAKWNGLLIIAVDEYDVSTPINYSADDGSCNRGADDITPDAEGDDVAPEPARKLNKAQRGLMLRIQGSDNGSLIDRDGAEFRRLMRLEKRGMVERINAVTQWRCEWSLTEQGEGYLKTHVCDI